MKRDMVVIAFDAPEKADEVLNTMKSVQHMGKLNLEDTVVVVKNADGEAHAHNAVDKSTKEGVAIGSLTGLFVGALLGGPVGLMIAGGIGGGAVGALLKNGVDNSFIKDVSDSLQPGTSALFMVIRSEDASVTLAAMRQYEGTVLHSTLPEDLEQGLERALKKNTPPSAVA